MFMNGHGAGGAPGEGEKTQYQTSYYPMEDSKLIDFYFDGTILFV